jgi:enhancing lycopene biosynthesis protein 2
MEKRVAVILSGCGNKDGAEIRESVLTLLALDSLDVNVKIFAPDIEQDHVTNHLTGKEVPEKRNVLVESARIARGEISALNLAKAQDFDAVILPGGMGAAENLSSFAKSGEQGKVNSDLTNLLNDFYKNKRPIGAICIAPSILGLLFGKNEISLTLGNEKDPLVLTLEKTGCRHKGATVRDIVVDEQNRLVTTPAYMDGKARLKDISEGIHKLVKKILEMC